MEQQTPRISVIIVNYKVPHSLCQALHSLREAQEYQTAEVIIVDNASNDQSQEIVTAQFNEVKWIQLKQNIGFGKACNIGAAAATGTYLLILNPDTIVGRTTLSTAVEFLQTHPEVGLLGPKLLNPNGTLQPGCRRGFPTPASAFYRFTGLSRLFPKSKIFGHYNLTWLDPELSCEVDAVSGSFMFMPRSVFSAVGGFDEQFFMYGEDLDLCWRVKEKGLKVWYHPEIQAIHLKGKSSAKRIIKSRIAFYEAMVLFSRKYHHLHGAFFPGWLLYVGILILAAVNIGAKLVRSVIACIIDLAIVNSTLYACLSMRFSSEDISPYVSTGFLTMAGVHALLSASFLFMFAYNGVYSQTKFIVKQTLFSGFFATVLFLAAVYSIKSIAFSRLAFTGAALSSMLLLVAWRGVVPLLLHRLKRTVYSHDRAIIIGSGFIPRKIIHQIEKFKSATISGIVLSAGDEDIGQFEGYPVLGKIESIGDLLQRNKVDIVLIATAHPWYSYIIEALGTIKAKNLRISWVPRELFDKKPEELPEIIPLQDFSL